MRPQVVLDDVFMPLLAENCLTGWVAVVDVRLQDTQRWLFG